MAHSIGIDIGSHSSRVAIYRDGEVEIIANDQGNMATPSWVSLGDFGRLIGDDAKNQAVVNPMSTAFDIKRIIGKRLDDPQFLADINGWPFDVIDEHGKAKLKFLFHNYTEELFPEEIYSMLIREMRRIAEVHVGKISRAVVTVPDVFKDSERQAVLNAARICGLDVSDLLDETMAAAITRWHRVVIENADTENAEKKNVLIFHLGGSSCTATIMPICAGNRSLSPIFVSGDTHLGGEDFDQRMVTHCLGVLPQGGQINIINDNRALIRLKTACEEAKRALTISDEATIDIDDLHGGINFHTVITRDAFQDMCEPLLNRIHVLVQTSVAAANVHIDEIVMSGGSTRLPMILTRLQQVFNQNMPNIVSTSDEDVVRGAAYHAALCDKKIDWPWIIKAIPHSITAIAEGYEAEEIFSISRDTELEYRTYTPRRRDFEIKILEGDSVLGKYKLTGFRISLKKDPKIKVCYKFDRLHFFDLTAKDKAVEPSSRVIVTDDRRKFTKEDIRKLALNEVLFGGEEEMDRVTAMYDLTNYVSKVESEMRSGNEFTEAIYKKKFELMMTCDNIKRWLDQETYRSTEEYGQKLQELQNIVEAGPALHVHAV